MLNFNFASKALMNKISGDVTKGIKVFLAMRINRKPINHVLYDTLLLIKTKTVGY